MKSADDKEVLAAEYVLGSLDADDRANADMLREIDPEFAAAITRWERCLNELHALIEPLEPNPGNWEWIKARIAGVEQSRRSWLAEPDEAASTPLRVTSEHETAQALAALRPASVSAHPPEAARVRRWQRATVLASCLALIMGAVTLLREHRPLLLPQWLRPEPQIVERVVERVKEIPSAQIASYVAIFNEGETPAFILSVDARRHIVSVRRLRKPVAAAGETLWMVRPGTPPRDIGALSPGEYTVHSLPAELDGAEIAGATFVIAREAQSATAGPAEPALRARLIQTTPSAFPRGAP